MEIKVGSFIKAYGERYSHSKPLSEDEWFLISQKRRDLVVKKRRKLASKTSTGQVDRITSDGLVLFTNSQGKRELAELINCEPIERPKRLRKQGTGEESLF